MEKIPHSSSPTQAASGMAPYVDSQSGWRGLFFALAVAGILGLSFRLYFSPDRMKSFIQSLIDRQSATEKLTFEQARLSLSKGAIPQFAIVLGGVKFAPQPECMSEPSLVINELTLPFRLTSLTRGRAAIAVVSAEGMVVDLDGIKKRCDKKTPPASSDGADLATVRDGRQPTSAGNAKTKSGVPAKPWWTPEQLHSIQDLVEGLDFKRVELQFEDRTKHVYLDSFEVHSSPGDTEISASTEIKFPPEIVYGEDVPKLELQAVAKADAADVKIKAKLDEGELHASAKLTPAPDNGLGIDLKLNLTEVPLSAVVPLLIKAGIAQDRFKPRFLWLDCGAHIQGPFQGLFNSSPLYLEKCSVEGAGTHVDLDRAIRRPNGKWDPLAVKITNVDLNRLTEMFSINGPRGVASDFGRLNGALEIRNEDDASFLGQIDDVALDFSNRGLHASQKIRRLQTEFALQKGQFKGSVEKVEFDQGRFDGDVQFSFDRKFSAGTIEARVKSLALDPRVQTLLVDGTIADISGEGEAQIANQRLSGLNADLRLVGVEGKEFRAKSVLLHSEHADGAELTLLARAPEVELQKNSSLFTAVAPLFFEHRFERDAIMIEDVFVQSKFLDNGDLSWERALARVDGRHILISSVGDISRSRELSGEVTVDYPSLKNLRWEISGSGDHPVLTPEPHTNSILRKFEHVDDRVLGLPEKKSDRAARLEKNQATESGALRELGEKVMERARKILPESKSE